MPSVRPPLRVAVVGGDPLARGGIAALIGSAPEFGVTAELDPAELGAASPLEADVVVWDLGARDDAELDALSRVTSLPVVALGSRAPSEIFAAGARAVLPRDVDAERLHAALRAVLAGLLVVDEAAGSTLGRPRRAAAAEPAEALTPRELEVLALLAEGLSNKLAAARLGISEHTVKFHVNAILQKLEVDTRTEAVVRAARLGLLML